MEFTPYHDCEDNRAVVERMAGKAVCAYENLITTVNDRERLIAEHGELQFKLRCAELSSEYQATVRCLDMLVRGSLHEICTKVVNQAEEELGMEE